MVSDFFGLVLMLGGLVVMLWVARRHESPPRVQQYEDDAQMTALRGRS